MEIFPERLFTGTIAFISNIYLILLFSTGVGDSRAHIIEQNERPHHQWGQHLEQRETKLLFLGNVHPRDRILQKHNMYLREKRDSLVYANQKPTKSYQACIAPGDKEGHCRHMEHCVLKDVQNDIIRIFHHMCIIEHSYVGVCCPDNVEELTQRHSYGPKNLVGVLPEVTDGDDKPVQDIASKSGANAMEGEPDEGHTQPQRRRGCGIGSTSKTRIVGGRPADPREWPWMVALIRADADHYCGGVLITDRHILTAAHCVHGIRTRDIIVRLGEYDFSNNEESRALDFRISYIRSHPDFNPSNYDNDISIIRIHRPTVFNTYIWPICLPPTGFIVENKSAIVTGWGTQYYGGPASAVLMEVTVPVWPQKLCSKSMVPRTSNSTLCAGAYHGGSDSCQGDSGGPLVHQLANGRWVNIGIVSWGIRCGEPAYPGIYTRVTSYLDWIFANAIF